MRRSAKGISVIPARAGMTNQEGGQMRHASPSPATTRSISLIPANGASTPPRP